MEAFLNIFYDFARDVGSVKDLLASFVSILKQVVERKLLEGSWIQMRILALLGVDDLRYCVGRLSSALLSMSIGLEGCIFSTVDCCVGREHCSMC